jgi:hypothetical protein
MRKPVVYIVLITTLIFTAGVLWAGDTTILDIKPPSPAAGHTFRGPDLKEGKFDGYGTINRIAIDEVVIDDAHYRLTTGVAFRYLDGRSTSVDNFPVGTRVWFVLYADNIIKSVWKEGR